MSSLCRSHYGESVWLSSGQWNVPELCQTEALESARSFKKHMLLDRVRIIRDMMKMEKYQSIIDVLEQKTENLEQVSGVRMIAK